MVHRRDPRRERARSKHAGERTARKVPARPAGAAGAGSVSEAAAVRRRPRSGNRAARETGGSRAISEAPALVAGLDDVAIAREPVQEGVGPLGVAEHARPSTAKLSIRSRRDQSRGCGSGDAEGEVGGDDDRGLLVEAADQMEQELPAGLGKGQVAELVEDDEVQAGEIVGRAAIEAKPSIRSLATDPLAGRRAAGAALGLEPVDEIDDVEEAAAGAVADAGPGDRASAACWRRPLRGTDRSSPENILYLTYQADAYRVSLQGDRRWLRFSAILASTMSRQPMLGSRRGFGLMARFARIVAR